MAKYIIEERAQWRSWVTPRLLANKPVHRWYVFPHSFTKELVHSLIDEWGLDDEDQILDPFAGAGTTLLAAKEKRVPARGYDLSPLAVFASRVKLANYSYSRLEKTWQVLQDSIDPSAWNGASKQYSTLVKDALPGRLLGAFDAIDRDITALNASESERAFFRLALLATLPRYSRAVATGGWLSWVPKRNGVKSLVRAYSNQIGDMMQDVQLGSIHRSASAEVYLADARRIPDIAGTYSAVITSPPYPNRHDYTRVFGVELLFGFLDWENLRKLRYQSFHSHPEAHPKRPKSADYEAPARLKHVIANIKKKTDEPRIPDMLSGYFLDIFLCLKEMKRVCRKDAKIALVVGNAQYFGERVPVDELTAELGELAGLNCQKLIAARFRGNSAQQMSTFGRQPSRESVVVFSR